MKKLLDSNLLLRFLLNDNTEQANAVQKLLESCTDELILTDVSIAEIIWVLTSYYKLPKQEVADKIKLLLALKTIYANKPVLFKALSIYQSTNVDYIDAYVAAYAEDEQAAGIYSFDKDFEKIASVKRLEP